jgi:FkbM family methyltransferase
LKLLQIVARQRWLRQGMRERVLRWFCPPESAPDLPIEVAFFGRIYRGRLSNYIDWHVFFYGAYEREILALIREILCTKADSVFMDVGANVGHHTLFASNLAARVLAFEPFEPVRAELEEKIRLNGIRNVEVHPVGLGDRRATLPFFPPRKSNLGTGSFRAESAGVNGEPVPLAIVTGDEVGLGLERLDLIKVDVEGYERAVLSGLRRTLEHHRPFVLFEYSEKTQSELPSVASLLALLPANYKIYEISNRRIFLSVFEIPGFGLKPVDNAIAATELLAVPGERRLPTGRAFT